LQTIRALLIFDDFRAVLTAIDFDGKLRMVTREVNDIRANLNLSAKVGTRQGQAMTQVPPEFTLGVGRRFPHAPRKSALRRRDRSISSRPDAFVVFAARVHRSYFDPHP